MKRSLAWLSVWVVACGDSGGVTNQNPVAPERDAAAATAPAQNPEKPAGANDAAPVDGSPGPRGSISRDAPASATPDATSDMPTAGNAAPASDPDDAGTAGPLLDAFPGAEGFGRHARGGRGGDVYHVINLNDSGPGSLREGIESAGGPRTIVFEVSGTIALVTTLHIQNKVGLTIAGQTAPGDGITLRDRPFFVKDSEHIVVRFLRSRLGDVSRSQDDAMSVTGSSNIIFDHCSASWSVDSVFDLTKETGLVTVQWCIISEALYDSVHAKGPHSMAVGWDGKGAGGGSYHHNLLASCNSRMPRIDSSPGPLVDARNNLIYNWGMGNAYGGEMARMNFVGNYYKYGPASKSRGWVFATSQMGLVFVRDNHVDGSPEVTRDNARGVTHGLVPDEFEVAPVETDPATVAYERVLRWAGASKARDAVDARIVADVEARTGAIIDSQAQVGGWPELRTRDPVADTDRDGMADAWERANGLDPTNPADRNGVPNGDGYTNLEGYLHSLVAHVFE